MGFREYIRKRDGKIDSPDKPSKKKASMNPHQAYVRLQEQIIRNREEIGQDTICTTNTVSPSGAPGVYQTNYSIEPDTPSSIHIGYNTHSAPLHVHDDYVPRWRITRR